MRNDDDDDRDNEDSPLGRLPATVDRLLKDDPLDAIARCQSEFQSQEKGHVQITRFLILTGYRFALAAEDDPDLAKAFYQEEFFAQRKYKPNTNSILRMSMCYLVGSLKGAKYERACNYAKTLQPYFDRNARPDEVAAELADHGIESLYRKGVGERRDGKEKSDAAARYGIGEDDDDETDIDQEDEHQPEETNEDDLGASSTPGRRRSTGPAPAPGPSSRTHRQVRAQGSATVSTAVGAVGGRPILEIEMADDEKLEEVLGVPVGTKVLITVIRQPGRRAWKRMKSIKVEILDD